VKNRRNLTPPRGVPSGEVHATRRSGGARLEVSARVSLHCAASGKLLEGWALNVSRGGVRVILEDKVEPGARFEVRLTGAGGSNPPLALAEPQSGRVVWVQEEPDGVVAGIEFHQGADIPPKS
jgi:hypothetical protein